MYIATARLSLLITQEIDEESHMGIPLLVENTNFSFEVKSENENEVKVRIAKLIEKIKELANEEPERKELANEQ